MEGWRRLRLTVKISRAILKLTDNTNSFTVNFLYEYRLTFRSFYVSAKSF